MAAEDVGRGGEVALGIGGGAGGEVRASAGEEGIGFGAGDSDSRRAAVASWRAWARWPSWAWARAMVLCREATWRSAVES